MAPTTLPPCDANSYILSWRDKPVLPSAAENSKGVAMSRPVLPFIEPLAIERGVGA